MPLRTQFHQRALAEFRKLDRSIQKRIQLAVTELERLDDARVRLVPYEASLAGFWKLRVGDYRLICEIKTNEAGQLVLIIHVVHRSKAYLGRNVRTVKNRANDN